ncbi:MAG: NADH-quinone oxidoreductase subunit H [Candidatus Methanomethylophilus sp.]|nr:NADH-quinone oxidoreductase subunit H [Methanomethylophilus sp.]MDD4668318.1 NADH-quinone oxidoreductase subunit H [Methanomethylophilus sp.]
MNWYSLIGVALFLLLAPAIGCLLSGIDRKITARMQRRVGPPVLQPYYDVRKLIEKDQLAVNKVVDYYVLCSFLFTIFAGCIFFAGGDLLIVVFTSTLADVFLVLAAYSCNSPYAQVGAQREIYQLMAYEPMLLLTMIGFYLAKGSYQMWDILTGSGVALWPMLGLFFGFLFILTIKFRKSPFDLSTSEHAHQDIVKGLTTEFSGKTLAVFEVSHWFETVLLLGVVFLFFANGTLWSYILGLIFAFLSFFLEIIIDNSFARMKWQVVLKSSWAVAAVLGLINIALLLWVL